MVIGKNNKFQNPTPISIKTACYLNGYFSCPKGTSRVAKDTWLKHPFLMHLSASTLSSFACLQQSF